MVGADKRSVASTKEKLGFDKRAKQRIAHRTIQSPQPLRLCDRQAKTRHLEVLAFHTSKHVEWLFHRRVRSSWVVRKDRPGVWEQPVCH